MNMGYHGNLIIIKYEANEIPDQIRLADGYSFDTISVIGPDNIDVIYDRITFIEGSVNSKSPCILNPIKKDNTKTASLRILILKFGQIPDVHYFDKAFEPILVTGDDGNEYNVIPSDQFK